MARLPIPSPARKTPTRREPRAAARASIKPGGPVWEQPSWLNFEGNGIAEFYAFGSTGACGRLVGRWSVSNDAVAVELITARVRFQIETLRLPNAAAVKRDALEGQVEYARNRLATKDRATVVDVLVRSTGAEIEEVEAFVSRLETR